MTEQSSQFSELDPATLGEALGADRRTLRDVAHGDGDALDVGDTVLEVYPQAGVARATTPDARIELYRVPRYSVGRERVVFELGEDDDRSRLLVRSDGKVSFYPVLRATESSTTSETVSSGHQDTSPPSTSSEGRTATTSSEAEPVPVQMQGRLGRDPWFNSQGDQPVAGFPLAVNDETGQTTWHKVVVFGEVADQVYAAHRTGQIRKGRPVSLTGNHVTREESTARGGVRRHHEFHASAVTRLTTTKPPPRGQ